MEKMTLKLSAPGMTSMHKAGLAGLYMTLQAFDENGTSVEGLDWELEPNGVRLIWHDDSPEEALDELLRKSFRVDDHGLFDFPALRTGTVSDSLAQKHLLYRALLSTFLQHNKHRTLGDSRELQYEVDGKLRWIPNFRPAEGLKHQEVGTGGSGVGRCITKSGNWRKKIKLAGWLFPGAGKRHVGFARTACTESPSGVICLLYALVGCFYYLVENVEQNSKSRAALVIPRVTNLSEYSLLRRAGVQTPVDEKVAASLSDAALRFVMLFEHQQDTKQIEGAVDEERPCIVITFGRVPWNVNQQSRTHVLKPEFGVIEKKGGTHNYAVAQRHMRNQRVERVDEDSGKTRMWIRPSVVRSLVADNVAQGEEWYRGFAKKMSWSDFRSKLRYERKELSDMVKDAQFEDANERHLVEACHEAWRYRMGQLSGRAQSENIDFSHLVNREREKLRVSLSRCKNAETLRETLTDFWARSGNIPKLRDHWAEIIPLLHSENWKKARDLAMLALASYQPDSEMEKEAMGVQTEDSDNEKGEEV